MGGQRVRNPSLILLATAMAVCQPVWAAQTDAAAPGNTPTAGHWGLIDQTCNKCHNSTDWAGGLAFDTLAESDIENNLAVFEKTLVKLRGRLMPPPGEDQPPVEHIEAFVHWLEGRLDSAAAQRVDPGYVGLHRLNRTEYAGEIRRLLDIDVDVRSLLPKDVSSEGFDNQAATLRISPSFLDQYISTARLVSRQAVGRASQKPNSVMYRVDTSLDQNKHIDGLPLGTRGGISVVHDFPADGEYVFNIRDFLFMGAGYVTKVDHAHRVILTIDDVRVFERDAGGPEDLKDIDQRQAAAADEMQARFNNIRVRVKAGPHRVGVAFVLRSFAQSDSPLQPIAMLPEMERIPRIPGFDISGPFNVTGLSDTPSRKRIFSCKPANVDEELPCARSILSRLASAAYRRPINAADLEAPLAFYAEGRKQIDFEAGIESGLAAILSSSHFLLRARPASIEQPGKVAPLNDHELATRLAFFIWSAGPDQELLDLATANRLQDPATLSAQIKRMMADSRSSALVTNFALQWLNVGRMDNFQPDPVIYPDFDRNLRNAMHTEIRLFLDSVLRSDRSVLDLLRADSTFLNERLAKHYGVPNIRGDQFRPVRMAQADRWGLFGKSALLMATSYGNRTSPVLRGAWVMEAILGTPPTAPPPGVEQFPENQPGQKLGTVRSRLEAHRAAKSCNSCHGVIDPLGFALENFDVTGGWRDRDLDEGTDIDSSGQLASGQQIQGPRQLAEAILARPDHFVHALTEKLMVFALGRPLRPEDMPSVRAITRAAASEDYRFESLIRGIAASSAFRMRQMPAPDATAPVQAAHVVQ